MAAFHNAELPLLILGTLPTLPTEGAELPFARAHQPIRTSELIFRAKTPKIGCHVVVVGLLVGLFVLGDVAT